MSTANEWWGRLPEDAKERLAADPRGPISEDLWAQVSTAGSADVAWADIQRGSDGYRLPEQLAAFVERRNVRLVAD
jgi:hypothetical protein